DRVLLLPVAGLGAHLGHRHRDAPHHGARLHRAVGIGHRLHAGLLDRPADGHGHLLDALLRDVLADGDRDLLDAGLVHHPADGDGDLLHALLGDHLASRHRDLLRDRVRDLLADVHRDLLADDLLLVDRPPHVLAHVPRPAHLPLAPGAGALDEAAVDADGLAGDEIPLDLNLVDRAADLLRFGPGHADRLALLAVRRLVHGLVA